MPRHPIIIMVRSRGRVCLLIHPPQVMEMMRIHRLLLDVVPGNFLIPAQKAVTENRKQKLIL